MFKKLLIEYKEYREYVKDYSVDGLKLIWEYLSPFYSERIGLNRVIETISELNFEETTIKKLREIHSLESNSFKSTDDFIKNLKKTYIVLTSQGSQIYVVSKLNEDGIIRTSRDDKGAK